MGWREWSSSVGRLAAPIVSRGARRAGYPIRLPANSVLQHRTGYLLKRPVGRPSHEVRGYLH